MSTLSSVRVITLAQRCGPRCGGSSTFSVVYCLSCIRIGASRFTPVLPSHRRGTAERFDKRVACVRKRAFVVTQDPLTRIRTRSAARSERSPCHTRRTLQARRARQRARRCIDKISPELSHNDLKKHLCVLEELSVCGPRCKKLPRGRALIHQVCRHLALVEDDAIDRALSSFVTIFLNEKMSWAADRLIAGLMFLDPRFSCTGTCGIARACH